MGSAIDAVTGDPGKPDTGLTRPLQHGQAELGLGGKGNVGRDARFASALLVLGPVGRQIERAVDQRLTMATGIAEEHADLAILDPTGGAAVLALHASRPVALFQEAGFIQHGHAIGIAQMLHDIGL